MKNPDIKAFVSDMKPLVTRYAEEVSLKGVASTSTQLKNEIIKTNDKYFNHTTDIPLILISFRKVAQDSDVFKNKYVKALYNRLALVKGFHRTEDKNTPSREILPTPKTSVQSSDVRPSESARSVTPSIDSAVDVSGNQAVDVTGMGHVGKTVGVKPSSVVGSIGGKNPANKLLATRIMSGALKRTKNNLSDSSRKENEKSGTDPMVRGIESGSKALGDVSLVAGILGTKAGAKLTGKVIESAMGRNTKKYLKEIKPYMAMYLTSVAKYDVYAKFGQPYLISDSVKNKIISVHQKYFGKVSTASVQGIAKEYTQYVYKFDPNYFKLLTARMEYISKTTNSELMAKTFSVVRGGKFGTASAVNTEGLIEHGTKASIFKGTSKDILKGSLTGVMKNKNTGLVKELKNAKILKAGSLGAIGVGAGVGLLASAVQGDDGSKVVSKTIESAVAMRRLALALRRVRKTLISTGHVIAWIGRAFASAVGSIIAVSSPVVAAVLIVLMLLILIVPSLLYGGLTHLASDTAMTETYAYVTRLPVEMLNTNYSTVFSTSIKRASKIPASVPDVIQNNASDGYIWALEPLVRQITRNINPMVYESLLSSYYTQFSFPYFTDQNSDKNPKPIIDARNVPLFPLSHLYLIEFNGKYFDINHKPIDNPNVSDYVFQASYDNADAHLLDFLYKDWWMPARVLWVTREVDTMEIPELHLRVYLGKSDRATLTKLVDSYAEMMKPQGAWETAFGGNAPDNFAKIVIPHQQKATTLADNVISKLQSAEQIIRGSAGPAQVLYDNSAIGGAKYDCGSVTDKNGNTSCYCYYRSGGYGGGGHGHHRGDDGYDAGNGNNNSNQSSGPGFSGIMDARANKLKALESKIKQDKDNIKKDYQDLIDKFQVMPAPPGCPFTLLEGTWYTGGELLKEQAESDVIISDLEKLHSHITEAESLISDDASYIGGLPGQYHPPTPHCGTCGGDCPPDRAWNYAAKRLNGKADSLSKIVKALKKTWTAFYKTEMQVDYTYYLNASVNKTPVPLDLAFKGFTPNEQSIYKTAYQDDPIALYILTHGLSYNKAQDDKRVKDAREAFVEIYNPYGTILRRDLYAKNFESLAEQEDTIRDLGYFFDPVAFAENGYSHGVNPTAIPPDFQSGGLPQNIDITSFFSTSTYVQNLIGLIKTTHNGFLDNHMDWYKGIELYKGDVITTKANWKSLNQIGGHGSNIQPFEVDAPIAGTLTIDPKTKNVVIASTFQSDMSDKNGNSRELSMSVTLSGVFLDSDITSGMQVVSGQKLGTAGFVEIDYTKQADLYYEWAMGHVTVPRDISFYLNPQLYFDWEPSMLKAIEKNGG